MHLKLLLAEEVVTRFWGEDEALIQKTYFIERFSKRKEVTEMPLLQMPDGFKLSQIIKEAGFAPSTSQAIKLINSNAVSIDGQKIGANLEELPASFVLKVGKLNIAKIEMVSPWYWIGYVMSYTLIGPIDQTDFYMRYVMENAYNEAVVENRDIAYWYLNEYSEKLFVVLNDKQEILGMAVGRLSLYTRD